MLAGTWIARFPGESPIMPLSRNSPAQSGIPQLMRSEGSVSKLTNPHILTGSRTCCLRQAHHSAARFPLTVTHVDASIAPRIKSLKPFPYSGRSDRVTP